MNDSSQYDYKGSCINGFLVLVFMLLVAAATALLCIRDMEAMGGLIPVVVCILVVLCKGFFVQEPNEARVVIFFGNYRGTCTRVGFFWINPFMTTRKLSLRIRNMDIEPIKVNDKTGNPVMIGMVLVWKISDTYKVVFDLDSKSLGMGGVNSSALDKFVRIQSDAALREVTGHFAYDRTSSNEEVTLRDGGDIISDLLEKKINERLAMAGIEVVEARLNYLAYSPEIAAVMLRRQQASAIISAREKIVEGAVSMVEMVIDRLDKGDRVKLDEQSKARMVGNLLVVLCADEPAQPIVGAGE